MSRRGHENAAAEKTGRQRAQDGKASRDGHFAMAPIARVIAMMLAASGVIADAHAQKAFSGAWFASKDATQSTAARTGRLPNGTAASSLLSPAKPISANVARSIDNLNMAARGIAAQQAVQAAARAAASSTATGIPDGLAEGGLEIDTHSLTAGWVNANAPVQSDAGGKSEVRIEQTAEKAILNWETFNVGRNTTVRFDQKAGTQANGTNPWIALNRVNDPSGKPSEIAGQIAADGSVYIVNRNGIVFNGSSQINTRTLVASSLKLSDEQFRLGINNPQKFDYQGNDAAIPQFGEFTKLKPDVYYAAAVFKPGVDGALDRMGSVDRFDPGLPPGRVTVEAGAQLDVNSGGKIMLFAPKVTNAGRLSAPDGQVILAAGENVYLMTPPATGSNAVRGLEVAVSAVPGWAFSGGQLIGALGLGQVYSDASFVFGVRDVVLPEMAARARSVGYEVVNSGTVQVDRGNITLQAQDIRQSGVLTSTTALNNRNGSILMRAWGLGTHMYADGVDEMLNWSAGTLTLDRGSVTQILPDASDKSLIESTALATRYQPGWVGMYGQLIDIKPQAGVLAPSGSINMESAVNPLFTQQPWRKGSLGDASRIYLDSEAFLSVAGLQDMQVDMARNFVEAELRINELRDSHLLLDSVLRGKKVIVDRRAGGVFEDGPMAGVQWVQRADVGGSIVYMPGEWVGTPLADVAGWVGVGKTDLNELSATAGSITLRAGGSVITRAGSVLDVSGGSVRYADGLNTATKLQGADGLVYAMDKAMPDMAFTGVAGEHLVNHARWGVKESFRNPLIGGSRMEAGYTEGRNAGSVQLYAGDAMVLEGDFRGDTVVGDRQQKKPASGRSGRLELGENTPDGRPWSPGTVIVSHDPKRLGDDFAAGSTLAEDFYLQLQPGESKSRKLTFLSDDMLSRSGLGTIVLNIISGDFELASGANLDLSPGASLYVAGTEGSTSSIRIDGRIRTAGGHIGLSSINGELQLGEHGKLDASGQWINAWLDGPYTGAWATKGGSLNLGVGRITADAHAVFDVSGGGRVDIGKKGMPTLQVGDAGAITLTGVNPDMDLAALNLRAYAAGSAGSLFIEAASAVQIGGTPADDKTVLLPPSLYAGRGFGQVSVAVRGAGGIVVPDGVTVAQQVVNLDLASFAWRELAGGASLADAAPIGPLRVEERLRRQPGSLSLGTTDGAIEVQAGAAILTDPSGTLRLSASGNGSDLKVMGRLEAPGGRIELDGRTVTLAAGAQLLARGLPATYTDALGHRKGDVLAGGAVDISGGALDLQAGAAIDVSGAQGEIDVVTGTGAPLGSGVKFQPLGLASDGGSIVIGSSNRGSMRIAATLLGNRGGAGARGGSLSIVDPSQGPEGAPAAVVLPTTFYWKDPVNGTIRSGRYNQILDLDLYDQYGTKPVTLSAQVRSAIAALPSKVGGGMEVVTDMDAPALPTLLKPAQVNPQVDPVVLDLLTRYFFKDRALTQRIEVPDVQSEATSRIAAASLSGGGFGSVSLDAAKGISLADGVKISIDGALNLSASQISNIGGAGSAELAARYMSLSQPAPYVSSAWSSGGSDGSQLTLKAQLLEVRRNVAGTSVGTRIAGYGTTVVESGEISLGGALPEQFGADVNLQVNLDVDGKLVLRSGQIYPTTGMTANVRARDAIVVERLQGEAGPVFSAGGTLRLQAPVIEQNGVLRAPFGQIELDAGERLVLGAGSLTSVSGAGLVVPYGTLSNNEHWHDPTQPVNAANTANGSLVAPPEKRVSMKAPDVTLARGAVVDIAGGGDLYAWEFVPGPGGSHDVLTLPGMYAVLPGSQGAAPSGAIEAGARVWLAGGAGLAAGWYNLLPARYALLPGAFAVQGTGTAWAGSAAGSITTPDGSLVMQGKGGNVHRGNEDAIASVWRVMPGDVLRRYSEFNEATSNQFFSSEGFKLTQYRLTGQDIVTPRLARDGGAVVFDAGQRLQIDGTLRSQPDAGGRGGLVDIAGRKIAIVGAGQDAAGLQADGYLVVDASSLSNFGAGSLLVGGTRRGDPRGLQLNVTATDIVVRNGGDSALFGPEIILAAADKVSVDAGSVVNARGSGASDTGDLVMAPQRAAVYDTLGTAGTDDDVLVTPASDWGALIRVSNGNAARVLRQGVDTTRGGVVSIGTGAVVDGGAALLIDATRTTELAGSATISGVDLSVAAGRIGFGGGTEGMVLDAGALKQLGNSKHLTLRSYSSFDFHESLDLGAIGLGSLAFDGAAFVGQGSEAVVLKGGTITLANSGGNAVGQTGPATGSGTFTLDAGTLVLGAGQKRISGFGLVNLIGRDQTLGEGSGGIDTSAALTLSTPLLMGGGGAAQSLATQGALQILAMPGTAGTPQELQGSLGSRFDLSGRDVLFSGRVVALGGNVDMVATGGSLVLADGARIDVGGFAKPFFDVTEYADAGRINLSAIGGDVRLLGGSSVNLAAHPDGGNAGILNLAASNGGTVVLDGAIAAQAGGNGKAGSFSLDIEALPNFAAFSQRLNDAGFNRSRQFRIRSGNVLLDGATTVEDFGLTADQGSIDITGLIDARSAYGGAIRITGGNGVSMQRSAQLLAGATGELGSGRVTLEAAGGRMDLRGGVIDVAGNNGGKVRLRAQQRADHAEIDVAALDAVVRGARSSVLEGISRYDVADHDGATVDSVKASAIADARRFERAMPAIAARLGTGITLASGIEIRSAGDLAMNGDWNLFNDFIGDREGTLTLRAGGNLLINGHLSDGFDQAGRSGVLQEAASWNLRLVAGGDLASANALALKPLAGQAQGQGNLVIGTANTAVPTEGDPTPDNGAGKLVRTGTGDLEVRVGRDLTLAHKESVIYTAGRKDMTVWSDFSTANARATYGVDGGNLDVRAQGSIESQHSGQRFVQWLNRQGNLGEQRYFGPYQNGESGWLPDGSFGKLLRPPEQSSWWIDYGAFQQGVGALGGGNVTVNAGGDLGNLLVALPTNMRMRGGRSASEAMTMETRNGGALTVDAGGAIRGGQYYVARGEGEIRAGETTTGHAVILTRDNSNGTFSQSSHPVAPVLALGDATLRLSTAGNLVLQTVVDPLLVRYGDGLRASDGQVLDYGAYMSGYTDRTALKLVSTGGDIALVNRDQFIFSDVTLRRSINDEQVGHGGNRYPARLSVAALNGGMAIEGPLYVMPSRANDVNLVARNDMRFTAPVLMAYATPEMLPSAFMPTGGGGFTVGQMNMAALLENWIQLAGSSYIKDDYLRTVHNPDVLPLAGDFEPSRFYAAQGSILGLDLRASEQTLVRAGTDIRGIRMQGRNVRASDVTLLEAGNDILAMTPVRAIDQSSPFQGLTGNIEMQGPGTLVLSAGRDVYADNLSIQTVGNQRHDASNRPIANTQIHGLPANGASVTVMAGFNSAVGYSEFAGAYLDPARVAAMPSYLKSAGADGTVLPIYLTDLIEARPGSQQKTVRRGLVSYMRDMTGETLAPLEAWERFQALPSLAQQQFIRQVYLLELREAGRDQNEPGTGGLPRNGGYNRGYEALKTLFPGNGWNGDVAANNLMLRTMEGGDINVLTPGGGLQVAALGATVPEGYGLVTLASGHINIFADQDVTVNRSRILSFVPEATKEGSDQIIWSTLGDIDAGRGSKTVRVPSAPEVVTDLDGNTIVREKSDMSGSGIGTVGDGDVDLVAPGGTVNAGDAGLRVAGNLNIAALQVLNADNIQVKGEAKGLPVVAAVNVGALTNASAAAAQATAAAQDVVQRDRTAARQALPSIFTVRVLGFGNEAPERAGTTAPARPSGVSSSSAPRYDDASPLQLVGNGQRFDAKGWARLTEEERRQLRQDR